MNDVAHHFLHNQNSLLYFHLSVSWQSLGQRNYMVLPNGYFGSSSWLPKRPFRDFVNGTNFSSNCRCKRYSPTYLCTLADSGFFENFLYRGGVKSTVSWVFEDLKFKRSIFQTFWKPDCCTKSLFFELETSNFGYLFIL